MNGVLGEEDGEECGDDKDVFLNTTGGVDDLALFEFKRVVLCKLFC